MISKYRKKFNQDFSEQRYEEFKDKIRSKSHSDFNFRVSESPIFLPNSFKNKLQEVSEYLIEEIKSIPNITLNQAIPESHRVPNDFEYPHFLLFDFGICKDRNGEIIPQLIELQAFPSLYSFMEIQKESYLETYTFLKELDDSIPKEEYIQKLKDVIVANENPENVIVLEIFPEQQKTNIDFKITEQFLEIQTVCVTKISKIGRKLFYKKEGKEIPIHRIYNRVIFDELDKYENIKLNFNFTDDLDVKWITHPNWFYKISKFILPLLIHPFIPKTYYVHQIPETENVADYVLKPLFSFAGSGVNLNPTDKDLEQLENKSEYILQKRVEYEPLFKDIHGKHSKAEIRMMLIWNENQENPEWIMNLVRMTKSEFANMNFVNDDIIWVGCSYAFFDKG